MRLHEAASVKRARRGAILSNPPGKRNRYGKKKKLNYDGHSFDSQSEMARYVDLIMLEKAGHIRGLQLQVRIYITLGGVEVRYPDSNRHMCYVADFTYYDIDKKRTIIEDVKMQSGFRTETYPIKRALVHSMGLTITEV